MDASRAIFLAVKRSAPLLPQLAVWRPCTLAVGHAAGCIRNGSFRAMSDWRRPASVDNPHDYFVLTYEYNAADLEELKERRAPLRAQHLQHAEAARLTGRLALGGTWADAGPMGGLLVFRGCTLTDVEDFAKRDPYVTGGLVRSFAIRPWTVVVEGSGAAGLGTSAGAGQANNNNGWGRETAGWGTSMVAGRSTRDHAGSWVSGAYDSRRSAGGIAAGLAGPVPGQGSSTVDRASNGQAVPVVQTQAQAANQVDTTALSGYDQTRVTLAPGSAPQPGHGHGPQYGDRDGYIRSIVRAVRTADPQPPQRAEATQHAAQSTPAPRSRTISSAAHGAEAATDGLHGGPDPAGSLVSLLPARYRLENEHQPVYGPQVSTTAHGWQSGALASSTSSSMGHPSTTAGTAYGSKFCSPFLLSADQIEAIDSDIVTASGARSTVEGTSSAGLHSESEGSDGECEGQHGHVQAASQPSSDSEAADGPKELVAYQWFLYKGQPVWLFPFGRSGPYLRWWDAGEGWRPTHGSSGKDVGQGQTRRHKLRKGKHVAMLAPGPGYTKILVKLRWPVSQYSQDDVLEKLGQKRQSLANHEKRRKSKDGPVGGMAELEGSFDSDEEGVAVASEAGAGGAAPEPVTWSSLARCPASGQATATPVNGASGHAHDGQHNDSTTGSNSQQQLSLIRALADRGQSSPRARNPGEHPVLAKRGRFVIRQGQFGPYVFKMNMPEAGQAALGAEAQTEGQGRSKGKSGSEGGRPFANRVFVPWPSDLNPQRASLAEIEGMYEAGLQAKTKGSSNNNSSSGTGLKGQQHGLANGSQGHDHGDEPTPGGTRAGLPLTTGVNGHHRHPNGQEDATGPASSASHGRDGHRAGADTAGAGADSGASGSDGETETEGQSQRSYV